MSKTKKITKYSIFMLFIMLPIIDCLRRTTIKNFELFGFSIIELFNMVIIGYTLILTIINIKNKKEVYPLLIYTIILIIYICFHDINILHFDTSVYSQANINVITESYYIIRVYYMPILLLFIFKSGRK